MPALSRALSSLGDPTRFTIFERVSRGPRSVSEIARGLHVSRPAVSQHLRVLSRAGLVRGRRAGNRRIYQVNPKGVEAVRAHLDRFWAQALDALKAHVETADV